MTGGRSVGNKEMRREVHCRQIVQDRDTARQRASDFADLTGVSRWFRVVQGAWMPLRDISSGRVLFEVPMKACRSCALYRGGEM